MNRIYGPKAGLYSIVDGDTIVCRSESVTANEIFAGIELGARNIYEVNKTTGFGMGLRQGRTCESVLAQLMLKPNIPAKEISYLNLRPPLSPLPLKAFETDGSAA